MTLDPERTAGDLLDPGPPGPVGSPVILRALQLGAAEVGVEEQPRGSNGGPRVNQYLVGVDCRGDWLLDLDPDERPWCARFVVWTVMSAVAELGPLVLDPLRGAGRGGGLASGAKWLRWAKAAGALRQAAGPGRVALIPRGRGWHVVWCWRVLDGDTFAALEGNSDQRVRFLPRPIAGARHWIELG